MGEFDSDLRIETEEGLLRLRVDAELAGVTDGAYLVIDHLDGEPQAGIGLSLSQRIALAAALLPDGWMVTPQPGQRGAAVDVVDPALVDLAERAADHYSGLRRDPIIPIGVTMLAKIVADLTAHLSKES